MATFNVPGLGISAIGAASTFSSVTITAGLTISGSGAAITGGVHVITGGIAVDAGGVTVAAGTSISMAAGQEQLITDAGSSGTTALVFKRWNGVSYVEQGRFASGGILAWGTTVTTSASAGDMVVANGAAVRGVNGAATSTFKLISIDSSNVVHCGDSGAGVPAAVTLAASTAYTGSSTVKGVMHMASDIAGTLVFFDGATGARYKLVGTAF